MSNSSRPIESVWDYPRPPALQQTPRKLQIYWKYPDGTEDLLIAETTKGYRVLETSHPPTYYLPPDSIKNGIITTNSKSSYCEWKGVASYHDLSIPPSSKCTGTSVKNRIWSYSQPTPGFRPIAGYLSFYASAGNQGKAGGWECRVDEEVVQAQEGDFYGGWVTKDVTGGKRGMKGGAGTWGW